MNDYLGEKIFFHQYCGIGIGKPTILQITLGVPLICWEEAFDFLVNNDVAFKEEILAFF
jgi:hypothetical protein